MIFFWFTAWSFLSLKSLLNFHFSVKKQKWKSESIIDLLTQDVFFSGDVIRMLHELYMDFEATFYTFLLCLYRVLIANIREHFTVSTIIRHFCQTIVFWILIQSNQAHKKFACCKKRNRMSEGKHIFNWQRCHDDKMKSL